MTYAVGIDIGGTKTAIGIVDHNGQVLIQSVIPTDLRIPPIDMIGRMGATVERLITESGIEVKQLQGIGIGAPGPLDTRAGLIACPPNLPDWSDVPVVDAFQRKFLLPTFLENDANAATLAEKWVGAAQENEHFIYVTISTGIGAGLFWDGKLISGARGNAGDIGHMVIDPACGTCVCGQKGCFEWVASGTAIARRGSELLGRSLTTQEVFDLYRQGHPEISQLVEHVFEAIGIGCVTLINLFDPEKIVIGGGVSKVGEPLFTRVQQYVGQYALNPKGRQTPIVPARSGQAAGIIGAAALILLANKGGA